MASGKKVGGRKKGTPNKVTGSLREAILLAAEDAGGGGAEGLRAYLLQQAKDQPVAFMGLLGKVLPLQVTGANNSPVQVITRVIIDAADEG